MGRLSLACLRLGQAVVLCSALLASPVSTWGQTYPSKAIRLVVPYAAGGTTDVVARVLATNLTEVLGQTIVVENRPGGDSLIATEAVAKAAGDGYTLLLTSTTAIAVLPFTHKRLPYDPFLDFIHLGQIAYGQYALTVQPSLPASTVAEVISIARAKPGKLTYASSSGSGYLAGELFKQQAGIDILNVPYKGVAPATTDLLGAQVDLMFASFGSVLGHAKTGKLRILAVTGEKRSPALPNTPTMKEAGIKDFEASFNWGISAPKATPGVAVKKLSDSLQKVLSRPDVADKFLAQGVEVRAGTSEQYTRLLRADADKHRRLLQDIPLKAD